MTTRFLGSFSLRSVKILFLFCCLDEYGTVYYVLQVISTRGLYCRATTKSGSQARPAYVFAWLAYIFISLPFFLVYFPHQPFHCFTVSLFHFDQGSFVAFHLFFISFIIFYSFVASFIPLQHVLVFWKPLF